MVPVCERTKCEKNKESSVDRCIITSGEFLDPMVMKHGAP